MMTDIPEGMLKVTVKWRTTIETCFLYLYLIFSIKNELSLIVENPRGEHLNDCSISLVSPYIVVSFH